MKVVLPAGGSKPNYYKNHVGFLKRILEYNKVKYSLDGIINTGKVIYPTATKFLMTLDSKEVVIDFSDNVIHMPNWCNFDAYFKYHYVRKVQGECSTIYPFSPISFYDWKQYERLEKEIHYTGNSNFVLNMQRPGGNASERRNAVRKILQKKYGKYAIILPRDSQEEYWRRINNCLVHVFVPGCRNDMLDRGHLQYLAFGCCTISPTITDELPYDGTLIPGVHYVQCKPSYVDLIEKIEWCRFNRQKCVKIGNNAKELFRRSCTPPRLWDWILQKIFK